MRNLFKHTTAWPLLSTLALVMLALVASLPSVAHALTLTPVDTALPGLMAIGAIGKASDMVIYQAEFQTGLVESLTQSVNAFNEASRGAIRLVPHALKGHYSKNAFFKDIAGLVTRRDITSTSGIMPLGMTQDEVIGVKVNRKIGPVAQTLDAIAKAGLSEEDASRAFGKLAGEHKVKDMLNTGLLALEAAIQATSGVNYDVTGLTDKKATPEYLNTTLSLFGDNAQKIICWVTHSKPQFDITGKLITDKVTGLADIVTVQGSIPAWLGRPAIITDSPALTDANGSAADTYNILGLVQDALVIEESEPDRFATSLELLLENMSRVWQAEYAYNITIKGKKYDTTGGINPNDGTLATGSNWDTVASDVRNTAGVRLLCQ